MKSAEAIIKLIREGKTFEEAKDVFPFLMKGTYKRYGGKLNLGNVPKKSGARSKKRFCALSEEGWDRWSLDQVLFMEAKDRTPTDPQRLVYNSLFGDGHVTKGPSPCFLESHGMSQAPYLYMKALCLGSNLGRVRVGRSGAASPSEDAQMHISTVTSPWLSDLRHKFYPRGYKDILQEELYETFGMDTLAVWAMDDGSRYGAGGLKLTVGKQPHYTREIVDRISLILSEIVGFKIYVVEDKISYNLIVKDPTPLIPYFHKVLAYKITDNLFDPSIGSFWGSLVTESMSPFLNLTHPFMEGATGDELLTYATSQVRYRGFPFPRKLSFKEEWSKLLKAKCCERGMDLLASNIHNQYPSSFFPSRFAVKSKAAPSPIQVFRKKVNLKKVLKKQLDSGGGIGDTHVRNALGFYESKVVAQFNPLWAKYLITKYMGKPNPVVLDSCAGWGGRLVGAALAGASLYQCIEKCTPTYKGLVELAGDMDVPTSFSIVQGSSEDPRPYEGFVPSDVFITCPPYYDYELYDPSDPIRGTYEEWLDSFLTRMLTQAVSNLKFGGVAIVVVGNPSGMSLVEDTRCMLGSNRVLSYVGEHNICASGRWSSKYKEVALVYRKEA